MADSQRKTANLFDISTAVADKYITAAGAENNGVYPDYNFSYVILNVMPNTTYRFKYEYAISTITPATYSDTHRRIIAYDANGNYISQIIDVPPTEDYYGDGTFTTPANCYKISINYINNEKPNYDYNIMLSKGAEDLPYEPYGWQHSLRKLTTATDTITTLPADLYADGNNATVGLQGNMSQSGTPTPQNPITPQETGERTGNLFDMSFYEGKSGITVSGNKATGTCDRFFNVKLSIPPELYGQELTWSAFIKRPDNPNTVRLQTVDNGSYKYGNNITGEGHSSVSFAATSTIRLYVNYANTGSDTIELSEITLNTGSSALPYEPYGYKLDIKSANTTTPVYLGEVETTRKIMRYELTGNEDWRISSSWKRTNTSVFYYNTNTIYSGDGDYIVLINSDRFIATSRNGLYNGDTDMVGRTGNNSITIRISDTIATTLEAFKTYLQQQYAAGTPVTIWYVLATETTGMVNEPIRKIGDYADTVSGITIPTITGKDTFDVLTTLKPSEVSLSYTGWHDASVKEWDGSEWQ